MTERPGGDAAAWEHYDDPANREPAAGAPQRLPRLPRPPLTEYVPVRFTDATFAELRSWAAEEGLTMSALIRRLVDDALARRRPPGMKEPADALWADALALLDAALRELEELRRQVETRRR